MSRQKIIAMIPARIGSKRLKRKNLALINGKPMIAYSVLAAKQSGVFDRIVINSDSEVFQVISDEYGVEFYKRPEHLGSSETKSDDVVLDFMNNHPSDVVAWVNSISPLQNGEIIRDVIQHFLEENLDSLITVKNEQVHCAYQGNPVNFDVSGKFSQTQDLEPVQPFVYSIMMWRTKPFVNAMKQNGYAFFTGKIGYYPVDKFTSVIIKTEEDLMLVDYILRSKETKAVQIKYHDLAKPFLR